MVIVGCTTVTRGSGHVDAAQAPIYRASVTASIEQSAASSSARESERQASVTKQAIRSSCEGLSSSSVDAITAVNAYVDAFNQHTSDVSSKSKPAIDALNRTADIVNGSLSDALAPDLRGALTTWVDAAHGLAGAISNDYGASQFNDAINRLNDSRSNALKLCDAAYR